MVTNLREKMYDADCITALIIPINIPKNMIPQKQLLTFFMQFTENTPCGNDIQVEIRSAVRPADD